MRAQQLIGFSLAFCLIVWGKPTSSLAHDRGIPVNQAHPKLRILSIDGGGIRGIIPARILQAIEEETGKHIFELFDVVIGNSTGGLVALALVSPNEQGSARYQASDLVTFYKQETHHIFHASLLHQLKSGWGLWGPKYNRKNLDRILRVLLKDSKLSQTLKPVLVISYSLDQALPHLWTTHKAQQGIHHDYYLCDVAGATSAAPTYFAPKILKAKDGSLLHEADGGLWANNPELTAVLAAKSMGNVPKEDVLLVSIGTGHVNPGKKVLSHEVSKLKQAGILGWLLRAQPNLIEMMMSADSEWSETLISTLYPHSYRLQVPIPQELSNMDNSTHVPKLQQLAEDYLKRNSSSFKELCKELSTVALEQP